MEEQKNDKVVISLDEISSTNAELKRLQQKNPLPEGSMVMTEFQTQGRGQAGNSWYSSKGKNLLFSFLLYPNGVKAKEQFIISQIVSLALKKVLDRYINNVTIKWPNDIYWKNKKIAGMLIENSLMGHHIEYTIVGIGLNVNEDEFPSHLPNPVSLKQITGCMFDREILITLFNFEFHKLYQSLERGEFDFIERKYMRHLFHVDGPYWFVHENSRFQATIKSVLPSGYLVLVNYTNGEEGIYQFKELTFEL